MSKRRKNSPGFLKLLAYVNATPDIVSGLYDLGILPEQVNGKKTASSEMLMIAFVSGYLRAMKVVQDVTLRGVDLLPAEVKPKAKR